MDLNKIRKEAKIKAAEVYEKDFVEGKEYILVSHKSKGKVNYFVVEGETDGYERAEFPTLAMLIDVEAELYSLIKENIAEDAVEITVTQVL